MNNFERIKNMTLDEMAEFLNYNYPLCIGNYECIDGIKQWLQQESEG